MTTKQDTAVTKALRLARRGPPEAAVVALDALLRDGEISHGELILAARNCRAPGADRLLELVARSDGRAESAAESVLRLRWYGARLPTPSPGYRVAGIRLALALPAHRFAVTLEDLPAPASEALSARGWWLARIRGDLVLTEDAALVRGHLEREFHRQLLLQVS